MKTFKTERVFEYPFSTLTKAVWRKYPNPLKPEVLGTDVIKRNLEPDGSLVSERIIHSLFNLPSWSHSILGSQDQAQYVYEKSRMEPQREVMRAWSRNITHARIVTVGETITYRGLDDGRTLLTQESAVEVHIPFCGYLEQYIVDNIATNSLKGAEALEWSAKRVSDEEKHLIPVDYTNGFGPRPINTQPQSTLTLSDGTLAGNSTLVSGNGTVSLLGNTAEIGGNTLPHGHTAVAVVDDISGKALKSVDEFQKSVDEFGGKAMKSVDEFGGKALKSVDEFQKSVDEFGGKAKKSVDEISEITMKSLDDMSGRAKKTFSNSWSPRALRCYQIFDDFFNLC